MKKQPGAPQLSLRGRAIKHLARREHSRAELVRKLTPFGVPEEIHSVLDQLEQNGLLSDARAATAYVRSHAARFGAARMAQTLRTRGISTELIESSLNTEEMPDELQRAREIWQRKFGHVATDRSEWARQARFLQGRGFSSAIICKLLKAPQADPEFDSE